jgi:hypothetical protein
MSIEEEVAILLDSEEVKQPPRTSTMIRQEYSIIDADE